MAKKKEEKPKTVLERVYNVPLRKGYQKAPKWKRTKKAVNVLKEFISKHMKSDTVKIGKYLNLELWKHGIKNPPHHIKVKASKDDKAVVSVELAELSKEALLEKKKEEEKTKEAEEKKKKKEEAGTLAGKIEDKIGGKEKKVEEKTEEKAETKEEKTEESKRIEKEEIKELKKEMPKVKPPKQATMPKSVEQRPTAPMQK